MLCLILIISLSLSRRDINCTSHNHQNSREEEGRTEIRPLKILNLVWGSFTSLIVLVPSALLTPHYENKPRSYHCCSPFPVIYHSDTWLYANSGGPELEPILMIHYKWVVRSGECKHWTGLMTSQDTHYVWLFSSGALSPVITVQSNSELSGSDVNTATPTVGRLVPLVPWSPGHMDKHCDGLDNEQSHEVE